VRHIFQLVKTAIRIRYFKAVAHMAIAHERIGGRVNNDYPVNYHPVVVIPFVLRFTGICPDTVRPFYHVKRDIHNGYLNFLRIRGIKTESDP
jgi:hypothetical protein